MKLRMSLKHAWMLIIFIAVILPSISIMIWYGVTIYNDKVNTALTIKRYENNFLAHKIEMEIQRLKTSLVNKSDALAIQLKTINDPSSIERTNELLNKIIQRDTLIHELILLSDDLTLISIIDANTAATGNELLSKSQLKVIKQQKGLNMTHLADKISIPLQGEVFVGNTVNDSGTNDYVFSISVPIWIDSEVKAVLIAYIQVNSIWLMDNLQDYEDRKLIETVDFILNKNNTLIVADKLFEQEKGKNQNKYIADPSIYDHETSTAYTGFNKKLVFGTRTLIPSLNWLLISEIEAALITQSILNSLAMLYLWTILGLIIITKIILILINRTLKPIQKACQVMNQVASGNYEYTLKATRILELDKLNNDIRYMADERQKAETNLNEKYQLQAKEKEQREMLDTMVVAVLTIDLKGVILSSNHAAEQLFGYSATEFMMMSINELMPDSIANKHDKYLQSYEKTGNSSIIGLGRDLSGKNRQGQLFPMRLLIAELPVSAEGKRRFIGSCIDLTEFKKREEQFQLSQKMGALGKLTGGIAHDFNNMLGIIVGYTQLLELSLQRESDSKLRKYVEEIRKAGIRGANLVKKLMAFSQQKKSDAACVDINELLLDEYDLLKNSLTIRVNLDLNLADDIWMIKVDKNRLQDSILNIVINAVYAMKEMKEAAHLTISTNNKSLTQLEAENLNLGLGDYIKISFLDTGIGIDTDIIEKIFDPFFTTKADDGVGLGLSQVYTFIKKCDGVIDVSSEQGVGTKFTLYLPRFNDENCGSKPKLKHDDTDLTGNETILVVDDEHADLTQELLENQGYKVFCANQGKKALEVLESQPIDLVISDIIMPEMDGFQLSSIIQKDYPHVKIQLISGYNDQSNLNLVSKNLSDNLLPKPFDSITLFKKIRNLLDNG